MESKRVGKPKTNKIKDIPINILEEHKNRTKWMDENLTLRERARIDREIAIKIGIAFLIYFIIMGLMWRLL